MNRLSVLACLLSMVSGTLCGQSRVNIGISGGVQTSLKAFDGGRSIGAFVLYQVSDHFQLSMSSGYMVWHDALDGKFSAVPVLAGIRLRAGASDIVPYGALEVGLFSIRTTEMFMTPIPLPGTMGGGDTLGYPIPIGRFDVRPYPFQPLRRYATTFGYAIGLGVILSVSERFDLDVGAKMQYLNDTRALPDHMNVLVPTTYGSTHEYFTSLSIGLLLRL